MKRGIGRFLALLFPLFVLTPYLGGSSLELEKAGSYWLSHYADYYEDVEGKLTLKDLRSKAFRHDEIVDHNFGFTASTYWFKTTLYPTRDALSREWWLRIYYPLLDDISVYGVDTKSGDLLFEKHGGDLRPFSEREVAHLNFLYHIPLSEKPMTLYVRVATESSMQVPMVLQTAKDAIEEDQRIVLITGLYYGLFIVIFLYNVIMYYYTKEQNYILYLLFITAFVTWQLSLNGIGQEYFWSDCHWMAAHGAPFFTALSAVTALLFSKHFLQTARFIPVMNIVLKVLLYTSIVVMLLSAFIPYRSAMLMNVGLAIAVPLLLLTSGVMVWRRKFRPARFYVMGWSSFLLGTVIIALNKYGFFHGYLFFNHAQQLGSALEMIFLSWALADRIKLMQDEYVDKLSTLNVTLQNKVAANLEKAREKDKMLMKQSRLAAMGEMIEQIAHQWRQPLNTLALIMQDLFFKIKLRNFDEAAFEKANEQINETLQYMSKTIDDFRNFHQMDKDMDRVAIEEVVSMALALNEASLRYAHIECYLHSDTPHYALIAKNEMVQIFMNLIKNARDAITEKRPEVGRIDIYVSETDTHVITVVEDNAGGIPEVIMEHIFEPYFTTKQNNRGTGLGLYMSRSIVEESMNGTLEAENGDYGARFTVSVPKEESVLKPENRTDEGSDHL